MKRTAALISQYGKKHDQHKQLEIATAFGNCRSHLHDHCRQLEAHTIIYYQWGGSFHQHILHKFLTFLVKYTKVQTKETGSIGFQVS